MSQISKLVKRHKELLTLQENPPPDFQKQIHEYIDEIQKSGRNIENPEIRDQLRSYLRFWSTVSYDLDNSSGYRIVELDEYLGRKKGIGKNTRLLIQLLIFIGMITGIIWLAICYPSLGGQKVSQNLTQTFVLVETQTAIAFIQPTITSSPTIENEIKSFPTVVTTFETSIISPQNGEIIYPDLEISGTYTNLPEGTSLHVLVQALNRGNITFVLPDYITILPNQSSGEWKIKANLENIFSLDDFNTTYIFTIGFVQSEKTRNILERDGITGFSELPDGVFQFNNQPITVTGSKFKYTSAPRLIYTAYDIKIGQMDIFMANEDGTEVLQITNTGDISETLPALSPDGNWIAFIGKEASPDTNKANYSIGLMDVNGNNSLLLFRKEKIDYTSLDWSPDGTELLFTGNYIDNEGKKIKSIYLLSLTNNEANLIELEAGNNWSPRWVSDNTFYYINGNADNQVNAIYQYDFTDSQSTQKFILPDTINDFAIGPENVIVLSVWYAGSFDLYILDLQDNKLTSLVENSDGYDIWSCWSFDFKKVYFTTNRDNGNNAIWSVDVSSGAQQIVLQPLTYTPDIGLVNAILPEEQQK